MVATYSTMNEIDFLNRLGSHSIHATRSKKELMRQYLRAALKRDNWGAIDANTIVRHCARMIDLTGVEEFRVQRFLTRDPLQGV